MMLTFIILLLICLFFCLSYRKKPSSSSITTCLPNFDIFVISLKPMKNEQLIKTFPNKKINIQNGIDIRSATTENILKSQMIDEKTRDSIVNGRKYHHEIGTHGAIGLAWANKLVFDKGDNSLLLFEEDYNILDYMKLREEINILQNNTDKFDIAVFGGIFRRKNLKGDNHILKPVEWMPPGWAELNGGRFFLLHAVFFTPIGRKKIRNLLFKDPIDMQIDSLYSEWAVKHNIRIILQHKDKTVRQIGNRKTTIQTDNCRTCI